MAEVIGLNKSLLAKSLALAIHQRCSVQRVDTKRGGTAVKIKSFAVVCKNVVSTLCSVGELLHMA